jgi:hypothetical protein
MRNPKLGNHAVDQVKTSLSSSLGPLNSKGYSVNSQAHIERPGIPFLHTTITNAAPDQKAAHLDCYLPRARKILLSTQLQARLAYVHNVPLNRCEVTVCRDANSGGIACYPFLHSSLPILTGY